ncbi:hypothetical protein [Dawidia soli]|uniref:STAS/SEC14 domain-containing protein n=1 Tax=Dawidia soli TaxID=2782352 RepID=A0AAP2GDL9_9BACT|nr:hypothetical protein [Dawidia soli]MBT1687427.1 hypothetical protein [Dawidia soli]
MASPYYQDEYATIELDASIPCIQVTLNGIPRFSEHYQLVQLKRLELLQREKANFPKLHMLTDSRTAGPVLDEDVRYFKENVMPAMEAAGIHYLAIVMPSNKFTQLTIREMTEGSEKVYVRYFDVLADAKRWLKEMSA